MDVNWQIQTDVNWPAHEAGMQLSHNEHKTCYQSAKDWVEEEQDNYDWESDEAKQRAIETDSIWTLIWFPETPTKSFGIAAPTFEELLRFANAPVVEKAHDL
jgi:hypothetical protein